jgi:hypothetical protein
MIEVCADCGTRHDQALHCKVPKAPFYAGCNDPWVRWYYETPKGKKVPFNQRKEVLWVVPCQTKLEQSVIFLYMREVLGTRYSTSFPSGLAKAVRRMKGCVPPTLILALDMSQDAIDWIDEEEYLDIIKGERALVKFRLEHDKKNEVWDYSKTIPKRGHKRSNGERLPLRRRSVSNRKKLRTT